MQKAVVCDLDGTLADCSHRLHLVKEKRWADFHKRCKHDSVNEWCKVLVHSLFLQNIQIIFVTGRAESCREMTQDWIENHVPLYPQDYVLHMRPDNDWRKDTVFKEEIYNEYIKDYWDVLFAIEDRDRVVKMWRRLGVVALQCAPDEVPL